MFLYFKSHFNVYRLFRVPQRTIILKDYIEAARTHSSEPEVPGSRVAWWNTTISADDISWMKNPSWVKYPPNFYQNIKSGDKIRGTYPWRIKIVMTYTWFIIRDAYQRVSNSPMRSSRPKINVSNSTDRLNNPKPQFKMKIILITIKAGHLVKAMLSLNYT